MEESKIELKDIYEDAIIEGRMKGSKEAKREGAKKRVDGNIGISALSLNTMVSKSLAKSKGADETVTASIAMGLQCSKILYGEIGEEFLRKKMEENGETFSQEEYSVYTTEQMLSGYNGRKREQIIQGVRDAVNDRPNSEANAAKAGIFANEAIAKLEMNKSNEIRDKFSGNELIRYSDLRDYIVDGVYGKLNKEKAESILDTLFKYFMQHANIVTNEAQGQYEELPDIKKIAYYIADLGYSEVERALKLVENQKDIG